MLTLRKASDRGHANYGWLDSHHSFSFANYYDPKFMGFRDLLVINEDRVSGGGGFGVHGHRNMEIITYVIQGALEHKDSLGTGSTIVPGDVQRMSAGKGIRHSEFNHSQQDWVHFLQIWIQPNVTGIQPSYQQHNFAVAKTPGQLHLVASGNPQDDALEIHANANLYAGVFKSGDRINYDFAADRHGWVQVVRGQIRVNGTPLAVGDGLAISDVPSLTIQADGDAEILLFDLA